MHISIHDRYVNIRRWTYQLGMLILQSGAIKQLQMKSGQRDDVVKRPPVNLEMMENHAENIIEMWHICLLQSPHRSTQVAGLISVMIYSLNLFPVHFAAFCFHQYTNFFTSTKHKNFLPFFYFPPPLFWCANCSLTQVGGKKGSGLGCR